MICRRLFSLLLLLVVLFCSGIFPALGQQRAQQLSSLPYQVGVLPPEPKPAIPQGDDIILYLHGGPGSRLEEAGDLVGPLLRAGDLVGPAPRAGLAKGKRYTLIAFDQPSQGYSSMVDPLAVVPEHKGGVFDCGIGKNCDFYPLVVFSENFIVAFMDALDRIVPIKKDRNIYIIGGSSGGALTLRMGHRPDFWIKKIVAWNAASVWNTYTHGEAEGKQFALNTGWGRSKEDENKDKRKDYFNDAFGKPTPETQPNPEEWYRGNRGDYKANRDTQKPLRSEWSCKFDYIVGSRLEQEEVYNPAYRRWHWRLGTEVLIFSLFNDSWEGPANTASDDRGKPPANYLSIRKPTLLVASDDDDWNEGETLGIPRHWENRWTRTRLMAPKMRNTPGYTLYVPNTGHSIHNERPNLFAEQIVQFLAGNVPSRGPLQVRPVFGDPNMPDEPCRRQPLQFFDSSTFFRPIRELLDNGDSASWLAQPAKHGKFSNGKNPGEYSLRLKQSLRDVAREKNPVTALANAAVKYYAGDKLWGNAFADLAVTGRGAYEAFRKRPPTADEVMVWARSLAGKSADQTKLRTAVQEAISRAYQVAWALRNPDDQQRFQFRRTMGWIAVSGENDPPARPVNVPSGLPIFAADGKTQVSTYPQYELPVVMRGTNGNVTFQVRYTIASLPGQPKVAR
jgi:pimeloyl-ACP methyl ester carboxylesterase